MYNYSENIVVNVCDIHYLLITYKLLVEIKFVEFEVYTYIDTIINFGIVFQ